MGPRTDAAQLAPPSTPTAAEAAPTDAAAPHTPADGLVVAVVGGAALWVLLWVAIQLHAEFGWTLPAIPGIT